MGISPYNEFNRQAHRYPSTVEQGRQHKGMLVRTAVIANVTGIVTTSSPGPTTEIVANFVLQGRYARVTASPASSRGLRQHRRGQLPLCVSVSTHNHVHISTPHPALTVPKLPAHRREGVSLSPSRPLLNGRRRHPQSPVLGLRPRRPLCTPHKAWRRSQRRAHHFASATTQSRRPICSRRTRLRDCREHSVRRFGGRANHLHAPRQHRQPHWKRGRLLVGW